MIYLESPGSGTFEVQDVPAIASAARARGVVTAIDNTWASPLFFRPLDHGIDISIHAATKYIVGHSDGMLGVVSMTEATYPIVRAATQDLGGCAGSEEVNLGLRGLRTLDVRMRRHFQSVLAISKWLAGRSEVARIFSPSLPGSAGHALWKRDFTGASGLFGIELKPVSKAAVAAMLDGYSYFKMGFSWGGYESLVLPTHPERSRAAAPWDGKGPTLRFHVGLESVDDLIADLEAGFDRLAAHST
jgi:cystathionine beta-lyase